MRKKVDILISILCTTSFIIAIKLSSLPSLRFLPDFILNVFVSSEEMRNEYALLYDIAIAFLISGLFYFMVDSIPSKIKEDRAKNIIGKYVGEVESSMFRIIKTVLFVYGISETIKGLGRKNFYLLDSDTGQAEREISFTTTSHDRKKSIKVKSYATLNTIVRNGIKNILSNIENIRKYEYLYAGNTGFMECIRNIELCSFVSAYNEQKDYACFLLAGSSDMMGEFVNLYRELKSFKMSNYYIDIDFDTEEETESYRRERQMLLGFQIVAKRRAEYAKHANENRTVFVVFYEHIINNSIVAFFKSHLQMEYVYPNEKGKIEGINDYKNIVILTTCVTKELLNTVKDYREKKNYQGNILVIYEYKGFSSLLLRRHEDLAVQFYWLKSCTKYPILNNYYWRDEPTTETLKPLVNIIGKLQGASEKIIV